MIYELCVYGSMTYNTTYHVIRPIICSGIDLKIIWILWLKYESQIQYADAFSGKCFFTVN